MLSREEFGRRVMSDFDARRAGPILEGKSISLTATAAIEKAAFETRALGHPDYEDLPVGGTRTAPMVCAFLDLTNFTGRSFWDHPSEVVLLADAVLKSFITVVDAYGGHALGLRGDGLFAGFSPGDPAFTATMALSACATALDRVENGVNPFLRGRGMEPIQARAGLDYGEITFVRTGSEEHSEVNPLGFAANFAAKCEKIAKSWEIVVGEGLQAVVPDQVLFDTHDGSPKRYQRGDQVRYYRYFDFQWRRVVADLPGVVEDLANTPTSQIFQG